MSSEARIPQSSIQDALRELCDAVAVEFELDPQAVRKLCAEQQLPNSTSYVGLEEIVDIPPGKQLCDLTLEDLSRVINERKSSTTTNGENCPGGNDSEGVGDVSGSSSREASSSEKVVPFLLRFCLGEFHYGQRATRLLPGQKGFGAGGRTATTAALSTDGATPGEQPPTSASDEVSATTAGTSAAAVVEKTPSSDEKGEKQLPAGAVVSSGTESEAATISTSASGAGSGTSTNETGIGHADRVSEAFDVLAREAKFRHLHQIAGWVDLTEKQIWDDYVQDTVQGKVRPGDRVFEAGCGVLAFLRAIEEGVGLGKITIGGVDGAKKTIELVQNQLAPPEDRENFSVGLLPDCLGTMAADSWDVVVCNSVFQYINTKEQAKLAVDLMVRMARRWVIIADVLDDRHSEKSNARIKEMSWTQGVPDYRCYSKAWWSENFDSDENLVSIRHVDCPKYARRKERYVVYIEKNAKVDV